MGNIQQNGNIKKGRGVVYQTEFQSGGEQEEKEELSSKFESKEVPLEHVCTNLNTHDAFMMASSVHEREGDGGRLREKKMHNVR